MKSNVLKIALVICALVLVAAVVLAVTGVFGFGTYTYSDAEKYTAGAAEQAVTLRGLDIDWINGRVNIVYHSGDTVMISETSAKDIGDDLKLRWWLDGDTLRVKFAKSGYRSWRPQEKELTLTLPEGIELDRAVVRATSGSLNIPEIRAKDLSLHVTSGWIEAAAAAEKVSCETTSGDIVLTARGEVKELWAESTSGSIDVTAERAGSLTAKSTSGSVRVRADSADTLKAESTSGSIDAEAAETGTADCRTTSGRITVRLEKLQSLSATSTSGSVQAYLPETPGFTARIHTTSGRVENGLAMARNGDDYTVGDGSARVTISTTSGHVSVDPLN